MTDTGQKTPARFVTIAADMADRRLDNFLLAELKGLPRTRVYRMIRGGEVRVNKGRVKPSYRLIAGDRVRIPPHVSAVRQERIAAPAQASAIVERIIYEDGALLVLDKPSGLAVHGGSGISFGAIELLRAARTEGRFLELVHRLDRDTSGVLLFAKKRSALRRLHEQFRDSGVSKLYTALLHGRWEGGGRSIDLPLEVKHRKNGERFVRVSHSDGGKPALSHFSLQQNYSAHCLMDVRIETGRTHQFGVHAAELKHPVVGDTRYAPDQSNPEGVRRLFLHAAELTIEHPDTGARCSFSAPLEAKLSAALEHLDQTP
jgi:23S rRNA pseudouridine955/2504/2580 synthase